MRQFGFFLVLMVRVLNDQALHQLHGLDVKYSIRIFIATWYTTMQSKVSTELIIHRFSGVVTAPVHYIFLKKSWKAYPERALTGWNYNVKI